MQLTTSLSLEQSGQLKQYATDVEIENFLKRLGSNYGDGQVLSFRHILNIFQKNFYKIDDEDYLTIYVDAYRSLKTLHRSSSELIVLEKWNEVKKFHDEITSANSNVIDDSLLSSYLRAVSPFKHLNQIVNGVHFELIANIKQLDHEGSSMNHCIATYAYIIASGQYIGFRVFNKNNNERLTLGLIKKDNNLIFNQLKGWGNCPAMAGSCSAVVEFCKKNNITINVVEDFDLFPLRK